MDTHLKIEYIDIDKLKPYDRNPRKIGEEELGGLKASLKELGFVDPLVINKNNVIIGGHQRCLAARELGLKTVPVVYIDLPPDKEKALNIALNNRHIQGDWTADLGDLLGEIKADLPDLYNELLFEPLEIDVPEVDFSHGEGQDEAADDVPEIEGEPIIKTGDLIMLGRHRFLCGDCLSADDMIRLMQQKKANMIYKDPPYGVSYAAKNEYLNAISPGNRIQTPIENDHKTVDEMKQLWTDAFSLMATYMYDGATYYISGPQGGELMMMMMMSIIDAGLELKHMLIWVKNNHVLGRCDYNYKHEPILYGWKPGAGHKFYSEGGEVSVWEIDKPHKSDLHPTMKPVELIARAIKNSSKQHDVVLDGFLGSGTTLIASEQLNRICYGMEIDPHYCQVAVQRWIDYTNRPEDVKVERDGKIYTWEELNV